MGAFSRSTSTTLNSFSAAVLAAPSGLSATYNAGVRLAWTASSSAWANGHRVYRSSSSSGPFTQVGQVAPATATTYVDSPGAGTWYYMTRAYYATNWVSSSSNVASIILEDPAFVFSSSSANTGSSCDTSAQRERDMVQGYSANGPDETMTRTGGTGTLNFCSKAFGASRSLAAGTTTVTAYFGNTAGSSCQITATLSVDGTATLGSGSTTIPAGASASTPSTWSFATTASTLSATDRLNLYLTWQGVKACDSTTLHYNAATAPSRVTMPTLWG